MKKIRKIIVVVIISLIILLAIFFTYRELRDRPDSMIMINGYPVNVYGEHDELKIDYYIGGAFDFIPDRLVDSFFDENVPLCVADSLYYGKKGIWFSKEDRDSLGITIHNVYGKPKGIAIRYDETVNMCYVTIHEFGHYFDCLIGFESEEEEWIVIAEKEAENAVFYSEYYSDPKEYFAHSFLYYLLGSCDWGNKERCPETYKYMDELINTHLNKEKEE